MSRIGKLPITIPSGVELKISGHDVSVKGPKGTLSMKAHPRVTIAVEGTQLTVKRASDSNSDRALHGLTRSLLDNMVKGVTTGFEKKLELNGVGFRAQVQGKKLTLTIGFSHPVIVQAPEGIAFEVAENILTVKGIDAQVVGETSAKIRQYYVPEPYKGKGIKYEGEIIKRKEGKRVAVSGGA